MINEAKPKKCRVCNTLFTPHMTTDRFCSPTCAVKFNSSKINHYTTYKKAKAHREPVARTRAKATAKSLDNWNCVLNGLDGHRCSGSREAHHILYLSEGGVDEQWNLITLCGKMHKIVHSNKKLWQPKLLKIRNGKDWYNVIDKSQLSENLVKKLSYLYTIMVL